MSLVDLMYIYIYINVCNLFKHISFSPFLLSVPTPQFLLLFLYQKGLEIKTESPQAQRIKTTWQKQ